jgi:tellurite resistance protein TehA-like permease
MNRAYWIVLGPTALVAVGYILVLREMGLEPPYGKLVAVVAALVVGFWWIGRSGRKNERV